MKGNVSRSERRFFLLWSTVLGLVLLIHMNDQIRRGKRASQNSGQRPEKIPWWGSFITCAYRQQSFVPCSRAIYKPTLRPFTHTPLIMTKRPDGSSSHADTSSVQKVHFFEQKNVLTICTELHNICLIYKYYTIPSTWGDLGVFPYCLVQTPLDVNFRLR